MKSSEVRVLAFKLQFSILDGIDSSPSVEEEEISNFTTPVPPSASWILCDIIFPLQVVSYGVGPVPRIPPFYHKPSMPRVYILIPLLFG